jgi:hypothetical protein
MNENPIAASYRERVAVALKPARAAVAGRERRVHPAATEPAGDILRAALPAAALDDRIAIVGRRIGQDLCGQGLCRAAAGYWRPGGNRGSARRVVGIARERRRQRCRLSRRGVRWASCRRADRCRDGGRARPHGRKAAGEAPPAPSTPAERLALWCDRLPSPAPEMLRTLAAQGERYMEADELAATIGKKPSGGHWNSGSPSCAIMGSLKPMADATGAPRSFGNEDLRDSGQSCPISSD